MQDDKILLELARLILPSGFIENFKITGITSNDSNVEISLDEFDNLPVERQGHKIESKGFLDAVTVRDFPLRDKRVNFRVRRRKWYDHTIENTSPTTMIPHIKAPATPLSLRLF